jgi:hypothetical protein
VQRHSRYKGTAENPGTSGFQAQGTGGVQAQGTAGNPGTGGVQAQVGGVFSVFTPFQFLVQKNRACEVRTEACLFS